MGARAQRRANLGEELIIFGNPFMAVATLHQAEKQKKVWEAKGLQVEIRPMHGGTYAVLATKRAANPKRSRRRNQPDEDATSDTDQAVSLFEKFHGKEPAETLELQRVGLLAGCGPLSSSSSTASGAAIAAEGRHGRASKNHVTGSRRAAMSRKEAPSEGSM